MLFADLALAVNKKKRLMFLDNSPSRPDLMLP